MSITRTGELPFSLEAELGRGCFGEVWLGEVRPFGRVAVKILSRPDYCSAEDWPKERHQLLREADRLAEIDHPKVVRVLGCAHDAKTDKAYIYTELCEGGSLGGPCSRGPVPLARSHRVVIDLLMGLEGLHGKGTIHRDVKPNNVLLVRGNGAKLADFGLVPSGLYHGYAEHEGYAAHLAPEVLATGMTSTKSDVWATGITIFRTLNGDPWWYEFLSRSGVPFKEDGRPVSRRVQEVVKAGGLGRRLPWMPHVPNAWRRFVRKALRDRPEDRFANATAMLNSASALPAQPNWRCSLDPSKVLWTMDGAPERQRVVEWKRSDSCWHSAEYRTEPRLGCTGRSVCLSSSGPVSPKAAISYLQEVLLGTMQ